MAIDKRIFERYCKANELLYKLKYFRHNKHNNPLFHATILTSLRRDQINHLKKWGMVQDIDSLNRWVLLVEDKQTLDLLDLITDSIRKL